MALIDDPNIKPVDKKDCSICILKKQGRDPNQYFVNVDWLCKEHLTSERVKVKGKDTLSFSTGGEGQ